MKNILRTLTLAPLLLGAPALAQFSPISPKINPLAGLPSILPSPVIVQLPTSGIRLPSFILGNSPTLTLSAPVVLSAPARTMVAPAAFAGSIVVDLPERIVKIPSYRVDGGRENVRNPLASVLPDATIRLRARRSDGDGRVAASAEQDKDDLDAIYDRGQSGSEPLSRRGPSGTNHRITTPEQDLERELGL
jgi:hypothetical protein